MAKGSQRNRSRAAARGAYASSAGRARSSIGRIVIACACAVELAAALVYLNAFGGDFVLDDIRLIRDNLRIRALENIPGLFVSPYWDLEGAHALYRPLVLATYAVNYAIGGLSTYGYTAVNITLHVAVSLVLFLLVRSLGGSLFVATVSGLLFAVHPVHTEAVTGISGRPELLAALFFLLAMHAHWHARAAGAGVTRSRLATLACFACALLSKESARTLLLVLPAMDALLASGPGESPLARLRWRALADYLPLAAVAVAYLATRRAVLGSVLIAGDAIAPLDNPLVPVTTTALGERLGATMGQALMTAFAVVTEYARLLVWPLRLSPDYSFKQIPLVTSALDVRFAAGVLIVVACVAGVAALWRRAPLAAFGLAFLALTFSIVSNMAITIGTICAERLMYLPSAGLIVAAASGIDVLSRSDARRRAAIVVLAIVVVLAAGRTWTRNRDWKTELSLWSAAIEVAPASARVQSEYGRSRLPWPRMPLRRGARPKRKSSTR
jgi:hypothetical protein